jgi:hypothetical protein
MSFQGTGTLRDISLEQLSKLMDNDWISGTADGTFTLQGTDFRELLSRSSAKLQFIVRNGSLPHLEIPDSPGPPAPMTFKHFTGELNLKEGAWRLSGGKLESNAGNYQVNGTASAENICDFLLTSENAQTWAITGSLAEPHVSPVDLATAQADAKPNPNAAKP